MKHNPSIMGIINLSAHSFYQGSTNYSDALKIAEKMAFDGAEIVDVGAVATNPAINIESDIPSVQQELNSVIPFIEALRKKINVKISVDTSRAIVMEESIKAGAQFINDQRALTDDNTLNTVVQLNVPVCLMHHFNPVRKPSDLTCAELLTKIKNDLQNYVSRCLNAGIKREHIILDPGFGGGHFGKTANENFYLLQHLKTFVDLGFPLLVGLSRKSMFADIAPKVEDRLYASIAGAIIAAMQGASIIRVHDVKETVDAIRVVDMIR